MHQDFLLSPTRLFSPTRHHVDSCQYSEAPFSLHKGESVDTAGSTHCGVAELGIIELKVLFVFVCEPVQATSLPTSPPPTQFSH